MAKRVNAEEFEAEVLKASLPVIVEFYSVAVFHVNNYRRF